MKRGDVFLPRFFCVSEDADRPRISGFFGYDEKRAVWTLELICRLPLCLVCDRDGQRAGGHRSDNSAVLFQRRADLTAGNDHSRFGNLTNLNGTGKVLPVTPSALCPRISARSTS